MPALNQVRMLCNHTLASFILNRTEAKEKELGAIQKNVIHEHHHDGSSGSDEDYSDDDDEGEDGYRPGGYHAVRIGDRFHNNRYVVIEKLGWGHFSTVWLCYDKKRSREDKPEFVALKIQKSASHYREAAIDEIELLNSISSAAVSTKIMGEYPVGTSISDLCLVNLVDSFDHSGPNGRHMCMCFEVLGENLLKVIKRYDYRGMRESGFGREGGRHGLEAYLDLAGVAS